MPISGCKYTINQTEETFDLMKLAKHYYKTTSRLTNGAIFSTDEIMDSTIKKINVELARKNDIIANKKTPALTYITSISDLQKQTYLSIGIDQKRLAPEFIESNLILNYIKNGLIAQGIYPADEDTTETLSVKYQAEVGVLHRSVQEILDVQKKTNVLGTSLHNVLTQLIEEKGSFNRDMERKLTQAIESSAEYLDGTTDEWVGKLRTILLDIYKVLSAKGRILTEVDLESKEFAPAQVHGRLDVVVVDDAGRVHIYDLKISRDFYEDWDSAKILTTDYQLAFYRALLGQYVDVNDASLNIIPIRLGGLTDGKVSVKNLTFNHIVDRLSEKTGAGLLMGTGRLALVSSKLIPPSNELDYNTDRSEALLADLKLVFPKYEIKTTRNTYDVEELLDKAVQNKGFRSDYEEFSDDRATIKNNWITTNSKEDEKLTKVELREKYRPIVQKYVDFAKQSDNTNVVQLRQKLITAIDARGTVSIDMGSAALKQAANNILNQYIHGEYKVVRGSEELTSLGFILLQDRKTNAYTIISISSLDQKRSYDENFLYEEVEYMKAFMFFNHFKNELNLDVNPIHNIVVYNLEGIQLGGRDLSIMYEKYSSLLSQKGITNNLRPAIHLSSLRNRALTQLTQIQRRVDTEFSEIEKKKYNKIISRFSESFEDMQLYRLKELVKAFIIEWPELGSMSMKNGFNFNSNIEQMFAFIQTLLLVKAEQIPIGDFAGMNNFNIQFSSVADLFAGVFTKDIKKYDEHQRKIGTIIEGLKTITPDRVGSKDLKNINDMISGTNSFIRKTFYQQSVILHNNTLDYYKGINYTDWEQNWVGDHREKFKDLWVKDSTGRVSNKWMVKNPYATDPDNSMSDSARNYLKHMLFELNKRRTNINLSEKEIKDINISSLEAMKSSSPTAYDKIYKSILDEDYFKMPLIRSQQINRNTKIFRTGYAEIVDTYKRFSEEFNEFINPQDLENAELFNVKSNLGYYEVYDVYAKQSDKFKEEAILKEGDEYFELDLDSIVHREIFSQIRKKYVDNILPIVNAYTWWMKMFSSKTNEDISKELEYITNRIKIAVLDESIVDPEFNDIIKGTAFVKRGTTMAMLAFRPVLLVKELTIGLYKGITLAATKIYGKDQFTMKDFGAALSKLMTIDNKFSKEFNLIDAINNHYGFANRDINTIYKKLQTNRRGFFMGLSPWMYSMNTIPDYYNRLALFLAKMIHDGSYEAHTLSDDGTFLYDPTKDARFSYYFEMRSKYLAPEGSAEKYLSPKSDQKFNEQKNLYNLITKQISDERVRAGLIKLEEGDIISDAYSNQEKNSYKTFTDTVYGYYDVDSQAEWHKTWYGIMYLQFLQFWPGKMSMWFGSKKDAGVSPIGEHVQKTRKNADGKKVPLWRKPEYNDSSNPDLITGFEEVEENTGDPALAWEGTPQEGLFISMMLTMKSIVTGDFKELGNEELRTRRAIYGLADGMLMFLIFKLISMLIRGYIDENGTDGLSGETLQFMDSVNTKVLNESNLWNNTFGALRSEPAFWTFSTKAAGDMLDTVQGDKNIQQLVSKNFRAFEWWQE